MDHETVIDIIDRLNDRLRRSDGIVDALIMRDEFESLDGDALGGVSQ